MSWWGKMVGGAFGFAVGGPIGAILGSVLGHKFDQGLEGLQPSLGGGSADVERVQSLFFTTTFSVMGHIAKADGTVSPAEIAMARQVMAQMQLNPEQQRIAINLFNEGKQVDFPLDEVLRQFRKESHQRQNLWRMFLEIQLHAAYADGAVHPQEQRILQHIASQLGFSAVAFARLEQGVRAAHLFEGFGSGTTGSTPLSAKEQLQSAYELMEISSASSDAEVKKGYRRMMNRHHPDKLVAKGLPEEMIRLATEKTQEIKQAYELIKQQRGMR